MAWSQSEAGHLIDTRARLRLLYIDVSVVRSKCRSRNCCVSVGSVGMTVTAGASDLK